MKTRVALCLFLGCAPSVPAWELLVTRDGAEIEGNIGQAEFIMVDQQGIETAIPRSSISRFDSDGSLVRAQIKDGSTVAGILQSKVEIEDGMVKRRFSMSDLRSVEFDRFISVNLAKSYSACPIRVELDAGKFFFGKSRTWPSTQSRGVKCDDMRVPLVSFSRSGDLGSKKSTKVEADVQVVVPPGEDQLVDVLLLLVQGESVIAKTGFRGKEDEGETSSVKLSLAIPPGKIDPNGPEPKFRMQVVAQDAGAKVEKGGFFWWFTFPIHL